MQRTVVVSVLVAAAAGFAALSRRPPASPTFRMARSATSAETRRTSLCPPGTLPDQGVCIPVPRTAEAPGESETAIPRRPDRPSDYARYVLPVAASGSPSVVAQDRSVSDSGAPRSGISISATTATPVVVVTLDGQDGPTEVVFAGALVGGSVVTRHTVRAGDRKNEYVVILGNLDAVKEVAPRTVLASGAAVGKVGSSAVYLDCRQLRPGINPFTVPPERFFDESVTIPVDPRNLLPKR